MLLSRRNALRSLFFAAPAIVAAPTLMRVSAKFLMPAPSVWYSGYETIAINPLDMQAIQRYHLLYANVSEITAIPNVMRGSHA